MGIDVNAVHNLASALASGERNAANKGKSVNQKGWVTKEQMRKDAAQKTVALLALFAIVTFMFKVLKFIGNWTVRTFGPKIGWTINILGLILLLGIPACTLMVAEVGQRDQHSEAEKNLHIALEREQKQWIEKTEAYRSEVRMKVKALAERCTDNEAVSNDVWQTFEAKSKVNWRPNVHTDYATEEIDRAYQASEEIVTAYEEKKIHEYFLAKAERVEYESKVIIDKLRSIQAYEVVAHVEYARDQFVKHSKYARTGIHYGTTFKDARKEIRDDYEKHVAEMTRFLEKTEGKEKIKRYVKERLVALTEMAKKDPYRRGDQFINAFDRKMNYKEFGGCIDYEAPFEDMKKKIDDEYRAAEKKITEAMQK